MTFYAFLRLSPVVQLHWVFKHGTFLANRWEDGGGVNLYHCADEGRGFFVELSVPDEADEAVVLRSFVSAVPLADYSHALRAVAETMIGEHQKVWGNWVELSWVGII